MADEELDPTGAATTAGDEAEASAEHESGDPGTEPAVEPTESNEDWKARYSDLEGKFDRLLGALANRGNGDSRAGGGTDTNPPTTPDPRTQRLADDIEAMDREMEELEGELKVLASDPALKKDPVVRGQIAAMKARRVDLERMGSGLKLVYEKVLDLEAKLETPEADRSAWIQFKKQYGHRFADTEMARLAFKSWKADQEAAPTKPGSPGNGNGGTGKRFTPAPPPRKNVDVRGVAAGRSSAGPVRMSVDDFDTKIEALREEGLFDEARELAGKVRDGKIDLTD